MLAYILGGGVTLHNKKSFRIGRDEITGKIRVELAESTQKNAYTHTENEVQKLISELTKEARASVRSSVTSYFKPLYQEAYKNRDSAEMTRIRKLLMQSKLYGGSTETSKVCRRWITD